LLHGQTRTPRSSGIEDFNAANPDVRTIGGIRKCMDPRAELAGYEPLFVALRKAGIPD
jgi:hypothetical protein